MPPSSIIRRTVPLPLKTRCLPESEAEGSCVSLPSNKFQASIYCPNFRPLCGVKFNDKFPAITSNGITYHKSIGTRYTAKKFRPLPTFLAPFNQTDPRIHEGSPNKKGGQKAALLISIPTV